MRKKVEARVLSVRIPAADFSSIKVIAFTEGKAVSTWVRDVARARADELERARQRLEPAEFVTDDQQISGVLARIAIPRRRVDP